MLFDLRTLTYKKLKRLTGIIVNEKLMSQIHRLKSNV